MIHQHIYDEKGNQLCCLKERKIYKEAGAQDLLKMKTDDACCATDLKVNTHKHNHHHEHSHEHDHDHDHGSFENSWSLWLPSILSFVVLILTLVLQYAIHPIWLINNQAVLIGLYALAFLPVGWPVIKEAGIQISKGDFFSEFFLMSIATIGAFAIGEYPEAVAVMLFYSIGEIFQTMAVSKAKNNIQSLLDQRPDEVNLLKDGKIEKVHAADVSVGSIVQVKAGEKLALDAVLMSEQAVLNTAALTGESVPQTKHKGEEVLAGMLNLNQLIEVQTTVEYTDSKLSKILEMVEDATTQKAPTELFIRKFSKIYTPIVVFLAIGICLLPFFFVSDYVFRDWLYRALIFLVISCPCALVISIPLGYFGGIGAGSRNGVLFKGSNFLDLMANIDQVMVDKTGTITEGLFKVQELVLKSDVDKEEVLNLVAAIESKSTHPVATAILEYVGEVLLPELDDVKEIAGHGMEAVYQNQKIWLGNARLMQHAGVKNVSLPEDTAETIIAIAFDQEFVGYLSIADRVKSDAAHAVADLKSLGVKTTMLSGDKDSVVQKIAQEVGIETAFGDLLPADKVEQLKKVKAQGFRVAFVGDGLNDAPVVALSDVGIAMGGLGSDATIATADLVIQNDSPAKIPLAIKIGKATQQVVWQNISLAFLIKVLVMALGAGGIATLWEAVFADVGVAILAILNAMRIQYKKF